MAMASRANQQRTLLVPASFQDLGELRGSWRTLMLTGLLASLGANHIQSSSTDKIASFLCLKESLPLFSRCRPIYMLNLHLQPQPLLLAAVTLFPTLAICLLSHKAVPATSSPERDHAALLPSPIPTHFTVSHSCPVGGHSTATASALMCGFDYCSPRGTGMLPVLLTPAPGREWPWHSADTQTTLSERKNRKL